MSAKFRRNHTSQKGSGTFIRILLFALVLLIALYYLSRAIGNLDVEVNSEKGVSAMGDEWITRLDTVALASTDNVQVIDHGFFKLGYDESYEQAAWVSYWLTSESLREPNVERTDWYTEDELVLTKSAHHRDYSNSGYSRGHLVPAGDMAFHKQAMEATFNMSNISPQLSNFNGGVWLELEELVRDWAYDHDNLFVVSGPIFKKSPVDYIGKSSQVAVPSHFFKAIMNDNYEAIGFILPHQVSVEPVISFAVSIDSVEAYTGIELFDALLSDEIEADVESRFEASLWEVNDKRYKKRITNWNNR